MKATCTNQCEKECIYCILEEENKANVYIHCNLKNKKYRYGQYIDCDDLKRKEEING